MTYFEEDLGNGGRSEGSLLGVDCDVSEDVDVVEVDADTDPDPP